MPSRAELEARAAAVGLDPATIHNDSVLEQTVIDREKNADTATGTLATGVLTGSANFADGETVTIGDIVYRFKDTPAQPYDVKIGADLATSLDNFKAAINASGTPGTEYYAGTHAHPRVTATTNTNTAQTVEARHKSYGNSIATTETCANAAWGAATLASGVPAKIAVPETAKRGLSGGANLY